MHCNYSIHSHLSINLCTCHNFSAAFLDALNKCVWQETVVPTIQLEHMPPLEPTNKGELTIIRIMKDVNVFNRAKLTTETPLYC